MSTVLNGFDVEFSATSFHAFALDFPNPDLLRALREREAGQWFFYWREGTLYGIPEVESPERLHGTEQVLETTDHRHLGLLAARIGNRLPTKFPKYDALRTRPFAFLGQRDELVSRVTADRKSVPPLVSSFEIRPRLELDARLYELRDGETRVGLFVDVSTKWDIRASVSDLVLAGIDVRGLNVVRRNPSAEERRLVGEIERVHAGKVHLSASYDDVREIDESAVWLEGSRRSFKRCLNVLLRGWYDVFDDRRNDAEAELLGGPGLEKLYTTMGAVLEKNSPITITSDIECRIVNRIAPVNLGGYKTVVDVAQGDYCFDPSKKKRDTFAWPGIERFGPYSRDTFAKRSPRILVLSPDKAIGKVGQFVGLLQQGITSVQNSRFAGGFASCFTFTTPNLSLSRHPFLEQSRRRPARDTAKRLRRRSASQPTMTRRSSPSLTSMPTSTMWPTPTCMQRRHSSPQEYQFKSSGWRRRISATTRLQCSVLPEIAITCTQRRAESHGRLTKVWRLMTKSIIGMRHSAARCHFDSKLAGGMHRDHDCFRGDGNYLLGHLSRDCEYERLPAGAPQTPCKYSRSSVRRNGWRDGDAVRVIFHAHNPSNASWDRPDAYSGISSMKLAWG